MSASGATTWAIAALALLWLGIAGALTLVAARRLRLAQLVLGAARANARLLEVMPGRPLLVGRDLKGEADQRLLRDLGIKQAPKTLSDLAANDSGIVAEDLEALSADVAAARASATRLSRTVRVQGSSRVFEVRGAPASDEPAGTMLLWFIDTSSSEEERATLA